jgi:hypothetical protein
MHDSGMYAFPVLTLSRQGSWGYEVLEKTHTGFAHPLHLSMQLQNGISGCQRDCDLREIAMFERYEMQIFHAITVCRRSTDKINDTSSTRLRLPPPPATRGSALRLRNAFLGPILSFGQTDTKTPRNPATL